MRKISSILLLLFFFIISCKEQAKPVLETKKVDKSKKVSELRPPFFSLDFDPYFTESNDTVSVYGPRSITRNILQDKNGHFWFATFQGLIHYDGKIFTNLTNKEGLRRHRIFALLEDKKNDLWFASIGAGVYHYDGTSFTNFTKGNGLVNDRVECILEDNIGNIWFGTSDGASCYDGKTFRNFTTEDGLADNEIHSMVQDKAGKIWFATTGGISVYNGKSFVNFLKDNDQPFNNVRSVIEDKSGNIWFGGSDGLYSFDGKQIINHLLDFAGYIYEDKNGNIWLSAGDGNMTSNMTLYRCDRDSSPKPDGKASFNEVIKEDGLIFGILEDGNGGVWYGTTSGICHYDGETFNYFRQ